MRPSRDEQLRQEIARQRERLRGALDAIELSIRSFGPGRATRYSLRYRRRGRRWLRPRGTER